MNLCPCPQHQSLGFRIPHITTGFLAVVLSLEACLSCSLFVIAQERARKKTFLNTQVSWHTMILLNFQKIKALCEDDTWTVDSLAAAIFRDGKAYVWSWRGGRVVLQREARQGVVVDDQQWKVVVGSMPRRRLYFRTPAFFQAVPMIMDLPGESAEDRADRATLVLQKSSESQGAAAYIIRCDEVEVSTYAPQVHTATQAPTGRMVSEVVQDFSETSAQTAVTNAAASVGSIFRTLALSYGPVFSSLFGHVGEVRLRSYEYGKSKLVLGAILAALLFIGGGVIWIQRQTSLEQKRIQIILAPYQQQFDQVQSIALSDKSAARIQTKELISRLQSQVSTAPPKSVDAKKLQALFDGVSQYYTTISEKKLDHAQVFYNFQLVKSAFIAKRATVDGDTAVFIDPEDLVSC